LQQLDDRLDALRKGVVAFLDPPLAGIPGQLHQQRAEEGAENIHKWIITGNCGYLFVSYLLGLTQAQFAPVTREITEAAPVKLPPQ